MRSSPARHVALLLCVALAGGTTLFGTGCRRGLRDAPPDLRNYLPRESVGPVPYDRRALEGQATLITFFATWCFPCLGQLGLVAELQETYGPEGLRAVAVGMDLEGKRVLAPFAQTYATTFPVVVADDALRAGQTPFGRVQTLPSTVILDRQGRVVVAWPGLANVDEVKEQVERALKTRAGPR